VTLFLLILVANSVTLLITVIAAVRFPSWSYRFLGIVSLVAALFALHQVVTGRYHPATLIFSALSSGLITLRVATNWMKFSDN
jgi:hypothetical protein